MKRNHQIVELVSLAVMLVALPVAVILDTWGQTVTINWTLFVIGGCLAVAFAGYVGYSLGKLER